MPVTNAPERNSVFLVNLLIRLTEYHVNCAAMNAKSVKVNSDFAVCALYKMVALFTWPALLLRECCIGTAILFPLTVLLTGSVKVGAIQDSTI